MRIQVIFLILFITLFSLKGFAGTGDNDNLSHQKTIRKKYDFNLFKLTCFDLKQPVVDSTLFISNRKIVLKEND